MKLKAALFVVLGALLLAGAPTSGQKGSGQDKAKCVATCKSDCKKAYDTCKKNAGSASAASACETSYKTCNSNCVNKACQ